MLVKLSGCRGRARTRLALRSGEAHYLMPMDAHCGADGTLVVHFDLLGADPGTVAVALDDDVLTVTADGPGAPGDAFSQRLSLHGRLDCERVRARFADGVVTVTVPAAEQA